MLHFSASELLEMETEELLAWHGEAVEIVKAGNSG
nr:hypothetical protein [Synergistes jonesii]